MTKQELIQRLEDNNIDPSAFYEQRIALERVLDELEVDLEWLDENVMATYHSGILNKSIVLDWNVKAIDTLSELADMILGYEREAEELERQLSGEKEIDVCEKCGGDTGGGYERMCYGCQMKDAESRE